MAQTIEQYEERQKRKNERLKRRQKALSGRPYLLTRVFVALLDFLLIIALTAAIEAIEYFTLFNSFGYSESINICNTLNKESHLFYVMGDDRYVSLINIYEGDELNNKLDEAIIYYYSNDTEAKKDNLLNKYNNSKRESGIFKDDLSVKDNITTKDLYEFYSAEYYKAIEYLRSSDTYYSNLTNVNRIRTYTLILSFTLSILVFYFIIPLSRKEGETVMQMVFKLCIAKSPDRTSITKSQIIIRSLTLVLFNFYIPILFYLAFGLQIPFTILITFGTVAFFKDNRGLHELASGTLVILKRRADALDALNQLTGQNMIEEDKR